MPTIICNEAGVTYSHSFIQGATVYEYQTRHIPSNKVFTQYVYTYGNGRITDLLAKWNASNPAEWSYTLTPID